MSAYDGGGVSESKGDDEPVLVVGALLAEESQGGMSITRKGTLNGVSIIIKQINPEVMAEKDIVTWETKNRRPFPRV
jgi:hypothetical protein